MAQSESVDAAYDGEEQIREYEYDAYGNELTENEGDENPYRYCSENTDKETGLIYLRNRYYDPELGRFLTEDPAQDGLNWYVYCGNNPVMRVDPTGLWSGELHYNMTQWIFAEFGLNSYHANVVAQANKDTDSNWDTSPLNVFSLSAQGRHFDKTDGEIDSRQQHADDCLASAVNLWNWADEAYYKGEISEADRHNYRVQALETLGMGLHSLQDIDAHLDYDAGENMTVIPHHTGILPTPDHIAYFDDPRYNISKDDYGNYVAYDSGSDFGSTRYSNSAEISRNYIMSFYKQTYQR